MDGWALGRKDGYAEGEGVGARVGGGSVKIDTRNDVVRSLGDQDSNWRQDSVLVLRTIILNQLGIGSIDMEIEWTDRLERAGFRCSSTCHLSMIDSPCR
jgi:hypothetical protein